MAKGREFYTEYPENPPDWYWEAGLHDACIIGAESFEFPFDYNKYTAEKNKYDRNMISLKIDAKGAMFDFRVKEIRFYNYKILSESIGLPSINLTGKKKIWWLADQLTENNGKYELDILLEDLDSYPEQFHFKLRFDRAEVDRK
ncbi:MAG: hypothetical protein IJ039_01135 [Clostridia bacterium]|nr:hypothetical protein [Clostridia bacterium]